MQTTSAKNRQIVNKPVVIYNQNTDQLLLVPVGRVFKVLTISGLLYISDIYKKNIREAMWSSSRASLQSERTGFISHAGRCVCP